MNRGKRPVNEDGRRRLHGEEASLPKGRNTIGSYQGFQAEIVMARTLSDFAMQRGFNSINFTPHGINASCL